MSKYGFVYIWRDHKHGRYYIGCHWGSEDDGYVCSSSWMKQAYKHRPEDFKRRILSRVYTNKTDTFLKEQEWLNLIKPEEIRHKYYNLHVTVGHWTMYPDKVKTVGDKISLSHRDDPNWGSWNIGKVMTDETKEKIRKANKIQFENEEQREMRRQKSKDLWNDPEYQEKQMKRRNVEGFYKGFTGTHTEETKEKIRKYKKGQTPVNKGKKMYEDQINKLKEAWKRRKGI